MPSRYAKSGIYLLWNMVDGKAYIGSSVDTTNRLCYHRKKLRDNLHHNKYLQAAWNKYGENSFSSFIVELVDKEQLIEREQYWLDHYKPFKERGYNLRTIAEANYGLVHKHTPEQLEKMRQAVLGTKWSAERKESYSPINARNAQHNRWYDGRELCQVCPQTGNILNTYPTALDAAEALGIRRGGIIHSIWKNQKYKGFNWKYQPTTNEETRV